MGRRRPRAGNRVAGAVAAGTQPVAGVPEAPVLAALAALVVVIAVVVHWPALSAQALAFDDQQYLTNNQLVQHPGWASAWRFLREVREPSTVQGYYQPLSMISLMMDCALGGGPGNLRPFHATSLALHAANTVLIIVLLWRLFGQPWVAGAVGLLFAVHPMTVEPVTWIGERKTLLATCFALLALLAYLRYVRTGRWHWYGLCLGWFVLALTSKPTTVPLPVAMLALDFWPLRRLNWRTVLEKAPLLLIAGVFAAITVLSQHHLDLVKINSFSAGQTFLLVAHNLLFYPAKMLWPSQLSPCYPFPTEISFANRLLVAAVPANLAVVGLLLVALRWTRGPLAGWLCFFVLLLPTLLNKGYSPSVAWDKYAYLPAVGLLIVLAGLVGGVWAPRRPGGELVVRRAGLLAGVGLVATALAVGAHQQSGIWRTSEGLHRYMLTRAPQVASLHNNLGLILVEQQRFAEAAEEYRLALRLRPDTRDANNNLGNALAQLGQLDEAVEQYRLAAALKPDDPRISNNLGNVLSDQGHYEEAIREYERAIRLDPRSAKAHSNLAIALIQKGRFEEGVEHYRRALEMDPGLAEARLNLGAALASRGRLEEAIAQYRQALQISPNLPEAHNNLGLALAESGRLGEAIREYAEALRLKPGYAQARENLRRARQQLETTSSRNAG